MITLHNFDISDFDQVIAAIEWYGRLSDPERYVAIDNINTDRWFIIELMLSAAILFIKVWPEQTAIDEPTLQHLAMLVTARNDAGGY